jgi:hypothetical protein
MNPEKLHLALNHLTFLFAIAAVLPLLVGLIWQSRAALVCGLILGAIAGSSTVLVMQTGESAYDRYEEGVAGNVSEDILHEHEERAETFSKVMYGLGIVSIVSLFCIWLKPEWVSACVVVVILFCIVSFGLGLYIANAGGKIMRPHFSAPNGEIGQADEFRLDKHDDDDDDHGHDH